MKKTIVGLIALGISLCTMSASAGAVNFANVRAGSVTPGSGHIGVDIGWGGYNPCHHSNDAYYGACVMSNSQPISYYKVMNFTPSGTNFPFGIFIDNQNTNYCTSASWCTNPTAATFNHGWANLIDTASLEIYPYNSAGQYNPLIDGAGGVRISVSGFPLLANGGRYSADVGNIALPQIGESNVGKLNGFVTYNGSTVSAGRAAFDVFQYGNASRFTSTNYPMYGFSSIVNNGDGYYSTGAVPTGTYKMYITDQQNGHKILVTGVGINTTYERLDVRLDQTCFGFASCTDPAP